MIEVSISDSKPSASRCSNRCARLANPSASRANGKPVAEVIRATPTVDRSKWIGSLKDTKIIGDIISPANDEDEWEVLGD